MTHKQSMIALAILCVVSGACHPNFVVAGSYSFHSSSSFSAPRSPPPTIRVSPPVMRVQPTVARAAPLNEHPLYAQPYAIKSVVISTTPPSGRTVTVMHGTVSGVHVDTPQHITAPIAVVPRYASQQFYRGPVYAPGSVYVYHQQSFPWLQFWLWQQYYSHPYGQQFPPGYGPAMGANGQWAASGPAVYDYRRDPCSPQQDFFTRDVGCSSSGGLIMTVVWTLIVVLFCIGLYFAGRRLFRPKFVQLR